jgi:quinoprotein glucose dehydrogenase
MVNREAAMIFSSRSLLCASFLIVLLCAAQTSDVRHDPTEAEQQSFGSGEWPVYRGSVDWPVYRGDPKGNQYAGFAQINATNVHKLRPAWEHHTGDASKRSTMYANPIVINGVMYISTPSLKAVALDAVTGRQLWSFDPAKYHNGVVTRLRNRGVAYWKGKEGELIFDFVRDRVYAIDAKSGDLIQSFGKDGYIDLRENLGVDPGGGLRLFRGRSRDGFSDGIEDHSDDGLRRGD